MAQKYIVRDEITSETAAELNTYSDLIKHLLYHRGIEKGSDAHDFLNPSYDSGVHDPYLMKDMEKAVERILRAIENSEKILIYSDYDCDGIPGGVVLHDFFKKIGFDNFENYFPHRYEEGYGVHVEAVENFHKDGVNLVITIDCGTSDVAAVERANELGIDVIITDHHLSQEAKLPPAYAILNPKQSDCGYPYQMLCGSGVAYKLVQGILKKKNFGVKEGMEKWFLDMVGFATLADMVPLKGENRIFAYYGLKVLRKTQRLGLLKLIEKAKIRKEHLNEEDIGFTLAPRINAASRMGKPSEAFELLTSSEPMHADSVAAYLNKINDQRKGAAAAMTKEVKKILGVRGLSERKVLVLGNPEWKPPLIGPVCNNIMEQYGVPVFMWGRSDGTELKGSCRSNGTVNLVELMKAVPQGLFLGFGGHKMSGGFSISHEKVHLLEDALNAAYDLLHKDAEEKVEEIFVDRRLRIDDVNWNTYNEIEKLSPFGMDNPRPTFLFENIIVEQVKHFGKEKNHLELSFVNGRGKIVPAIGFFATDESFVKPGESEKDGKITVGKSINLVANIEKSVFRSYPELRLRIVDII